MDKQNSFSWGLIVDLFMLGNTSRYMYSVYVTLHYRFMALGLQSQEIVCVVRRRFLRFRLQGFKFVLSILNSKHSSVYIAKLMNLHSSQPLMFMDAWSISQSIMLPFCVTPSLVYFGGQSKVDFFIATLPSLQLHPSDFDRNIIFNFLMSNWVVPMHSTFPHFIPIQYSTIL